MTSHSPGFPPRGASASSRGRPTDNDDVDVAECARWASAFASQAPRVAQSTWSRTEVNRSSQENCRNTPLSAGKGFSTPRGNLYSPPLLVDTHTVGSPNSWKDAGRVDASTPTMPSSPGSSMGNEELWSSIERYLFTAYTALHDGVEDDLRPLKAPKHRMEWYATVYNACNGNPSNSRELYTRLALAVFRALEVFVLYPMLQRADRSRLEVVTGEGETTGDGDSGRPSGERDGVKTPTQARNGSFRFVKRFLFGGSDGGQPQPRTSERTPTVHPRAEPPSPWQATMASSTPSSGRQTPAPVSWQTDMHATTGGATGLDASVGGSSSVYSSSPHTAQQQRQASSFLLGADSRGASAIHAPALVSQDTGRVLVDEEELLLPNVSHAPSQPHRVSGATTRRPSHCSSTSPERHDPREGSVCSDGGARTARPKKTHYSPCEMFIEEYATFGVFSRIVLSCFRYLDQYYTRRFGMDTLSMMCTKLFYVVVYEPVKPLLVDELLTRLARVREASATQAPVSAPPTEEIDTDVQIIQRTLGVVTELIVAIQATSSYLVAGDAASPGLGDSCGARVASTPRPVNVPSLVPTSSSTAPSAGTVNDSAASADLQPPRSTDTSPAMAMEASSAPISVANSPRASAFDFFNHSGIRTDSAQSTPAGAATSLRRSSPAAISSRRRLINIFKGGSKNRSAVPTAAASAPTTPHLPVPSNDGGGSAFASKGATAEDPQRRTRTQSCGRLQGEPSGAAAKTTAVPAATAAATPPLVVDLRSTIEVRSRLESRTLSVSLANQAMRHAELGNRGGDGGERQLTGTIIKEIVKPLEALIIDDIGGQYLAVLEQFYLTARQRHLGTAELRRDYMRWVRDTFALEQALLREVAAPCILIAAQATLSRTLIVDAHRFLILDPDCGLMRLLEVWTGCRNDDDLVSATLGSSMAPESATPPAFLTGGGHTAPVASSGAVTAEDRAAAVGRFVSTVALSQDDSCLLLMASVLATKVIRDCGAVLREYILRVRNIIGDGRGAHKKVARALGSASWEPLATGVVGRGSPATAPPDTITAASHALCEGLVGIASRYNDLIREHMHLHPQLLDALDDAMAEVLNPERWQQTGAVAVAAAKLRVVRSEGPAMDTMSGSTTSFRRVTRHNVLLSRDAGAKASAPFKQLLELEPLAGDMNLAAVLAMYSNRLCARPSVAASAGPSNEVHVRVRTIAHLVGLFDQKDMFLECYKELLARRLLDTTAVMDTDRAFLQLLMGTLGPGSVYAFETMLRDCATTEAIQSSFERSEGYQPLIPKLRTQILSSAQWPAFKLVPLVPHPSLQEGVRVFETFYQRIHPSRTLCWLHHLATARLIGDFPLGRKEITANAYQATILLLVSEACNRGSGSRRGSVNDKGVTDLITSGDGRCSDSSASVEYNTSGQSLVDAYDDDPLHKDPAAQSPAFALATPTLTNFFTGIATTATEYYRRARRASTSVSQSSGSEFSANVEDIGGGGAVVSPGGIRGVDIASGMGLPFAAVRPHLASLVHRHGMPLLLRHAAQQHKPTLHSPTSLQPEDSFTLNPRFSHPLRKIRLQKATRSGHGADGRAEDPTEAVLRVFRADTTAGLEGTGGMAPKAAECDIGGVQGNVNAARRHQLDSAIIRVMKSRRSLPFHELVALVGQHVSRWFLPTAKDIKTALESLIERDFITRDAADPSMLVYNA